ncbi:MAG: hypothetical protein MK108_04895 [Mariniblastus sp.]|nr:hypothetical protein [Mariniblastus sp.]
MNCWMGTLTGCLLLASWGACGTGATGQEVSSIQVPDGFQVTKFAGDDLATNIFSMTLDPEGRVVVSGPGYIRRLIDRDGDGAADAAEELLSLKQGAQGMHFEKQGDATVLYFVGDGGLWVVPEQRSKLRRKILTLKTGGEHDAHSIQRGPDGCLYLLCGNGVPIQEVYYNDPDSPVKKPQAGFLMKVADDGQQNSIIAHGFRNAYDFAFNRQGQIFTFDSDGERDVSLPWYRPTRVFQLTPGDHAGFLAASWKRPSHYFDMPREIGALGRGSPTGVACYHAEQFPPAFHNAILVADWTFGQIFCFHYDPKTESYDRGSEFAVADGQFGFAVTDLVVGSQGELWVSVGGRGTEGGVYCIRYVADRGSAEDLSGAGEPGFTAPTPVAPSSLDNRLKEPELAEFGQLWKKVQTLSADQLSELDRADLHPASRCLIRLAEGAESNEARVDQAIFCMERLQQAPPEWRGTLIRCVQLALGGAGRGEGPAVFFGYQAVQPVQLDASQSAWLSRQIVNLLPACGETDQQELGRLAAMLALDSPELVDLLASQSGPESRAVDDIHWLICIAKLSSAGSNGTGQRVADTLVQLPDKMEKESLQIDRNWVPRMSSLVKRLFERAEVIEGVVQHAELGRPEHVYLYQTLPEPFRPKAAPRFLAAVRQLPEQVTAEQLLIAVSVDPGQSKPLLRSFVDHPELADIVIRRLSRQPELVDRELFARGLLSADLATVESSAKAMRKLDLKATPDEQMAAFAAALRLGWEPKENRVRDALIPLLRQSRMTRLTPDGVPIEPEDDGYQYASSKRQDASLDWYRRELATRYPVEFERWMKTYDVPDLAERLERVDWKAGDAERGQIVFQEMQCAKCHDQGNRLGPRLEGITKRFSRRDLFRSIVSPDEQVPHRYRALVVETVDGQVFRGMSIYDSVDGLTLLTRNGETVRINREAIEQRKMSAKSLMPSGLLDRAADGQWADLHAYLSTL